MEVDSCRLLHAGKFNTRTHTHTHTHTDREREREREKDPHLNADVWRGYFSRIAPAYHEIISLIIILSVVVTRNVEKKTIHI